MKNTQFLSLTKLFTFICIYIITTAGSCDIFDEDPSISATPEVICDCGEVFFEWAASNSPKYPVTLRINGSGKRLAVISGEDAINGSTSVTICPDDIPTDGKIKAEWRMTRPDGKVRSQSKEIEISVFPPESQVNLFFDPICGNGILLGYGPAFDSDIWEDDIFIDVIVQKNGKPVKLEHEGKEIILEHNVPFEGWRGTPLAGSWFANSILGPNERCGTIGVVEGGTPSLVSPIGVTVTAKCGISP